MGHGRNNWPAQPIHCRNRFYQQFSFSAPASSRWRSRQGSRTGILRGLLRTSVAARGMPPSGGVQNNGADPSDRSRSTIDWAVGKVVFDENAIAVTRCVGADGLLPATEIGFSGAHSLLMKFSCRLRRQIGALRRLPRAVYPRVRQNSSGGSRDTWLHDGSGVRRLDVRPHSLRRVPRRLIATGGNFSARRRASARDTPRLCGIRRTLASGEGDEYAREPRRVGRGRHATVAEDCRK